MTDQLTQRISFRYHCQTKHTVEKLFSGSWYLDWANQPDPFRVWEAKALIELPVDIPVSHLNYLRALEICLAGQFRADGWPGQRKTGGVFGDSLAALLQAVEVCPADRRFVSALLFYSMSISAWKQIAGTGERWALRVNPSSGNLHPTETHVLIDAVAGLLPGAYHYRVKDHQLALRGQGDHARRLWLALTGQPRCPPLIVLFTSILWREIWKYRQRGYRYCQHDMGHALAAMMLSAAALGWQACIIGTFPDRQVSRLIAAAGECDEEPALVIGLVPLADSHEPGDLHSSQTSAETPVWESLCELELEGMPNRLSREVITYREVESVHQATCLEVDDWQVRIGQERLGLPVAGGRPPSLSLPSPAVPVSYQTGAQHLACLSESVHSVVRRRRSAVDLDLQKRMPLAHLGYLLSSSTRGFKADFQRPTAWDCCPPESWRGHHLIALYLYVHRVDGLEPGIYYYDRIEQLLYPLALGDQRQVAKFASCFQDIAADGCFALSMVADLKQALALYGDRGYRFVHYEAGVIGQWLYLGSTALGYDSTGIGCFIDDMINELLDLPGGAEVIYNFTVGAAVVDPRLTTLPSYPFADPTRRQDLL